MTCFCFSTLTLLRLCCWVQRCKVCTPSGGASLLLEPAQATPQQKMRWAYKEGTAPMLVTPRPQSLPGEAQESLHLRTVTTCGSFYANCFSIVTVVRS